MSPEPPPLINWDQIDAIAGGWPSDFVVIFREFLRGIPVDFDAAAAAIAAGDATALERHAHQAKGSAANFGFDRVSACAAAVMAAAKAGDFAAAEQGLECARQSFVAGLEEVRQRVPACENG